MMATNRCRTLEQRSEHYDLNHEHFGTIDWALWKKAVGFLPILLGVLHDAL